MSEKPLNIAFVWNQHQPYYKDTVKNEYIMPWVRLHGCKNYYQMVAILREYPTIRATFNLTPALIEQIEDYLEGEAVDYYMLVMKPARALSSREKSFLLQHYFDIHWDRVVALYPRYQQLLNKQGRKREPVSLEGVIDKFSTQDYLDLQVWFNLVWIDLEIREKDLFLRGLQEKGSGFTEEDKTTLLAKQWNILQKIIPEHRELQENRQIEIITTPYYHPILPLLIDSNSALRANPDMPLPKQFAYPQDAREQTEKAIQQYEKYFGFKPYGVWPPEQAVSPETITQLVEQGFRWTISDEEILSKSLGLDIHRDEFGHVTNPEVLYQPYRVNINGSEISMIFRDHYLSDKIGFSYHHMSVQHAVDDLQHRLHKIRENLHNSPGNYLVTISLDGENAWEWYPGDRKDFLHQLYRRLSDDQLLNTVTVNTYLEDNPPSQKLNYLFTGSWVHHSLARWIGTRNKNVMWDYLTKTRKDFQKRVDAGEKPEIIQKARESLFMAEGSDFPWWVDSTSYYLAAPFEALFRKHLMNVYKVLGMEVPEYLKRPVLEAPQEEREWKHDPLAGPTAMA
ncbi:glycoside hydrolase family 57 protein [Candidatus Contubernalis alkaliaceticus]|uniref:glycoside hydrolase family 57 protein n=1 Tax=Candidatus Contubernalis alkaliaceticus TaxID=338645 RepID=UPI001F4C4742|nr:glycoside hydrolase family 57 protein [Candidatus Contubernalis alkalaceticus]UNC93255.1 glycoside hydrolase [Candidatus Contubernalis alkalaceticus]